MPTLYSGYPSWAPGFGLLLLRLAVGATLMARAVLRTSDAPDSGPAAVLFSLLALASGASLIMGFLTRAAAVIAAALAVMITSLAGFFLIGTFADQVLGLDLVAIALAIALLGPGAISLDAVFFGQRKVIIPPRSSLSSKP